MPHPQSPFRTLVNHFVKRLSDSEEEQSSDGIGLGLGAILALLASPGAFASIFLFDKYSTLLQWLRGQRIDAIRSSPADEYFFVVLSMTITGLVVVARWNRLFPDRRDFSNLAVLPIPIRNIFLANFIALLGLAVVFGTDVNFVSALLFPLVVTLSIGTTSSFLRVGVAHALTVFSASLFSFFTVFGLVGVLMLLVPKRIFRLVSVLVRMSLVVLLLTEFFANIFIQLFAGRLPGGYLHWLPSYWFLGVYETILGIANPEMQLMAQRALMSLLAAIVVSTVCYALCYGRFFIRLPETFDTLGGSRPFFRITFPDALLSPLFRSPFERACSSFALKVLLRSEQHLMFLGAYLGVGLVIVAQTTLDVTTLRWKPGLPPAGWLAIPLLIAFFIVSGLRFAFDRPAVLPANWLFRIAANLPVPEPHRLAKRLMLWATLPWEIFVVAPLSASRLGWPLAILHVGAIVAFTVLAIDLLLLNFQKIPFTCSASLDLKRLIIQMIGTIVVVVGVVPALSTTERWMLAAPLRFLALASALAIAWFWLARQRRDNNSPSSLLFEQIPESAFELLKLT